MTGQAGFAAAGIVLAAGASSRMGSPKALLDAGGETFLARLARALRRGGCDVVLAVTASGRGAIADEARRAGCGVVVNPGGAGGQIGSLRAALGWLSAHGEHPGAQGGRASRPMLRPGRQAFLFTPVDNPFVDHRTVQALVAAWRLGRDLTLPADWRGEGDAPGEAARAGSGAATGRDRPAIVLPRCGDRRGHPVLSDMAIAPEFLAPGLPEGARTVVRRDPGRVCEVVVADPGVVDDIDTGARYAERMGSPL